MFEPVDVEQSLENKVIAAAINEIFLKRATNAAADITKEITHYYDVLQHGNVET